MAASEGTSAPWIQRNGELLNLARRYAAPKSARRADQRVLTNLADVNDGHHRQPGCMASCGTCSCVRAAVSLKKRRFVRSGFDLDLSYITNRIIAMGFPSTGCESCYRNSAASTRDFLTQRHGGHYKLWNLCSEPSRVYTAATMGTTDLSRIGFPDHNAPAMEQIERFCNEVDAWLAAHPDNVAVVHCKAGKGRTGTMISAYLLWSGAADTAAQAMDLFGRRRTHNRKGVVIPSQIRFVRYVELWLRAKARAGARLVHEAEALMQLEEAVAEAAAEAAAAVQVSKDGEDAASSSSTAAAHHHHHLHDEDEDDDEDDDDDHVGFDDAPTTVTQALETTAKKERAELERRGGITASLIGPWSLDMDPSFLPRRPVVITSLALSCLPVGLTQPLYVAVFSSTGALLATTARASPGDGTFREVSTGSSLPVGLGGLPSGPTEAATPAPAGRQAALLERPQPPRRLRSVEAAGSSAGEGWRGGVPAAVALLQEGFRIAGHRSEVPVAARAASGTVPAPTGSRVTFASLHDDEDGAGDAQEEELQASNGGAQPKEAAAARDPVAVAAIEHDEDQDEEDADRTGTEQQAGDDGGASTPLRTAARTLATSDEAAEELAASSLSPGPSPSSLRLPGDSVLSPGDGFQSSGYGPLLYALPRHGLGRREVSGAIKIVLLSGPTEQQARPLCWFWLHTAFLPFPAATARAAAVSATQPDEDRDDLAGPAAAPASASSSSSSAGTRDAAAASAVGSGDSKDAAAGGDASPGPDEEMQDEEEEARAGEDISGPEEAEAAPKTPAVQQSTTTDADDQTDATAAPAQHNDDDDEEEKEEEAAAAASDESTANAPTAADAETTAEEASASSSSSSATTDGATGAATAATAAGLSVAGATRVGWVHLPKPHIDRAFKDKKHRLFPEHFALTLFYEAPLPVGEAPLLDTAGGGAAVAHRLRDESLL